MQLNLTLSLVPDYEDNDGSYCFPMPLTNLDLGVVLSQFNLRSIYLQQCAESRSSFSTFFRQMDRVRGETIILLLGLYLGTRRCALHSLSVSGILSRVLVSLP